MKNVYSFYSSTEMFRRERMKLEEFLVEVPSSGI